MARTLWLSSLLLATGLAAQTSVYVCPCTDSVCVDPNTGQTWRDNRVRAYTGSGSPAIRIYGLMQFDVSKVPDTALIFAARLVTTNEQAFSSPMGQPVVDVFYSADDVWTRATAGQSSGTPAATMAWRVVDFSQLTHTWHLDLAAHDLTKDLADDRVTLGLYNVKTAYSYFYLIGPSGSPTGPAPYLELHVMPGPSLHPTIGLGCNDSGKTAVQLLARQGLVGPGTPVPLEIRCSATLAPFGVVAIGAGTASWGGIPLPLDLAFAGAPGCRIWAGLDFLFSPLQLFTGGNAFEPMIPNNSALKGFPLFFQALVIDPGANALGIATTNAKSLVLW